MASESLKNKTSSLKKAGKKKKKKISETSGIAHIHSTTNNTIISISDKSGNTLAWASAGTIGYKGTKKSTPYAAGLAASDVAKKVITLGIKSVDVSVNGTGQGKDTAIRSLHGAGLAIETISDNTPVPHNGCKPPKKPR